MTLDVIGAPTGYPLALGAVKDHLRVDGQAEDDYITGLMAGAASYAEGFIWRALLTRPLDLVLDAFPAVIRPPLPPLRSVTSITYIDTAGASQTLAASKYQVDAKAEPARIKPAYGEVWPGTRAVYNAVTVRYEAGLLTPFTASSSTDIITAAGHPYADTDVLRLSHSGDQGEALPAGLAVNTDYYARDVTAGVSLKVAATSGGAAIDITDKGNGTHYLGTMPEPVRRAMLLVIGDWYANRETIVIGVAVATLPKVTAADHLLFTERNHLG